MNFLHEIADQGRRTVVDVLSGGGIERDSPHSPDVPEDLRQWLPDLFDRFPVVLPWEKPKPVDPALDNVWILDNTAFRSPAKGDDRPNLEELKDPNHTQPAKVDASGRAVEPAGPGAGWEAEFVTCYFIKNSGRDVSKIAAEIAKRLNVADDDEATHQRIVARMQPFADTVLPNRTLRVVIDGKEQQTLGPSSYSGISSGLHELHFQPDRRKLLQSTPVSLPPPFSLPNTTVVAEETGWGVISGAYNEPSIVGRVMLTSISARHRRHNQSHDDTVPDRHPTEYFHSRHTSASHRHARTLCPYVPHTEHTNFLLPFGLAIQSLPLPQTLPRCSLPDRHNHPP